MKNFLKAGLIRATLTGALADYFGPMRPVRKTARRKTKADHETLARAEQKRARRAARNLQRGL